MKRRSFASDEQLFLKYMPQILLLAAVFIVGGIIGSLFAANLPELASAQLNTYSQKFAETGFGTVFASVVWVNGILLIAIFLSAFSRVGTLVIPVVFLVKGFNLSMLITAFMKVYGVRGYLVTVSVESLYAFGVLACMIFPAARAILLAASMGKKSGASAFEATIGRDNSFLITAVGALVIIIALSILYAFAAPLFAGASLSIITK